MQSISLGILGGGNMARALIRGLLASKLLRPEQIRVSDVRQEALKELRDEFAIVTDASNQSVIAAADVVLVAVKPQAMSGVIEDLKASYAPEKLLISIAAGVQISTFIDALGTATRVVRAMPNTPALVLAGATAVAGGGSATEQDVEQASSIFEAVGLSVILEEAQLDAVTGLSGSGPGYMMLIVQALADAGVKMGLSRQVSLKLVTQTVYGSAKLLLESGEHPAVLKDRVASPGGTTITGLCALEEFGLRHALMSAVERATEQSQKLGKR